MATGKPPASAPPELGRDVPYIDNEQMLVHCNGDAASDAMIDAVAKAAAKYGSNVRLID